MRSILETIAADTPTNAHPYLALLLVREASKAGVDPETPHVLGRLAALIHPDGPDDRLRAVARVLAAWDADPDNAEDVRQRAGGCRRC